MEICKIIYQTDQFERFYQFKTKSLFFFLIKLSSKCLMDMKVKMEQRNKIDQNRDVKIITFQFESLSIWKEIFLEIFEKPSY